MSAHAAALAELPGVSIRRLRTLLDAWSAEEAWSRVLRGATGEEAAVSARWKRAAALVDVDAVAERYATAGVAVHVLGVDGYPDAVAGDHEAPAVLFSRGDLTTLTRPRVAIVGARRCTPYGRQVARSFGRSLAEAGVAVVSGLALGIDGAAHEGVLAAVAESPMGVAAAPPIGVVGSGLDVVYPRRHRALWDAVGRTGVLVSEAPLGAAPEAWRFPARNRIIAALAEVLVVVEAHDASGSRHTVDAAIDRDVRVLAVPGPIHSPASAGVNRLLRDGCGPACDVEDVLVALRLDTDAKLETGLGAASAGREAPTVQDARVLEAVDWTPTSVEEVLRRTGLSPPAAAAALARLERQRWAGNARGWWHRLADT